MTTRMQQKRNKEDTALTRTDLMRLLEDTARPEQLDVSSQDLREAIFREKTNVIVAERFSEKASRYALGFALGLPCMSVVGFMMVLGIRAILAQMRPHKHSVNH